MKLTNTNTFGTNTARATTSVQSKVLRLITSKQFWRMAGLALVLGLTGYSSFFLTEAINNQVFPFVAGMLEQALDNETLVYFVKIPEIILNTTEFSILASLQDVSLNELLLPFLAEMLDLELTQRSADATTVTACLARLTVPPACVLFFASIILQQNHHKFASAASKIMKVLAYLLALTAFIGNMVIAVPIVQDYYAEKEYLEMVCTAIATTMPPMLVYMIAKRFANAPSTCRFVATALISIAAPAIKVLTIVLAGAIGVVMYTLLDICIFILIIPLTIAVLAAWPRTVYIHR